MALKSTIFKAELSVADVDRGVYGDHSLTLARHPSETDERMMVRLLAFALHADERLEFGPGLSAEDEPDLVRRALTGEIDDWIDVGLPDERAIRKACGRARAVHVYAYGGRSVALWWEKAGAALERQATLTVREVPQEASEALAMLAARTMTLQVTVQDGHAMVSGGTIASSRSTCGSSRRGRSFDPRARRRSAHPSPQPSPRNAGRGSIAEPQAAHDDLRRISARTAPDLAQVRRSPRKCGARKHR